jgi:hypothetical protein
MKDVDELKETVKELEKELSSLVQENKELQVIRELKVNEDNSIEKLQEELSSLLKDSKELKANHELKVNEEEDRIKRLEKELSNLAKENNELKASQERKVNEEEDRIKKIEKELSNLVKENKELKASQGLKVNEDDSIRNEARRLFIESAKNGSLNDAMSKMKEARDMEVLKNKAKDTLANAAKAKQLDENDSLQKEARGLFVDGSRNGSLKEALSKMSEAREMDVLKNQAKDTLANAAKGNQLRDTLQWLIADVPKTEDPVAKFRLQARDNMLAALEDGRLGDILGVVKPPAPCVVVDGSISAYYTRHVGPAMDKNAWATIHCMFEPAKKIEKQPVKTVDEDSIQMLNTELEQLAKDRAALLEQVNMIRSLMVDVAADNNRLAQEVLARPMSGGAQMCLTHSLSNML